jgi:hypothetical protein
LGYFESRTDEQLVAFRTAAIAIAPIIMDVAVALVIISFYVGSWPLFVVGYAMPFLGMFTLLLLSFIVERHLECRRQGQWYEEDTLSATGAISKPIIIGFIIAFLLLGFIPKHGKSPHLETLAWSIGLAAVAGITLWIAFRFVNNVLRKYGYEMRRLFDLRFDDAMKAAEEVVGRLGGSISKRVPSPRLGKANRVEFSIPSGGLRIQRLTSRKTRMDIQKSQVWRIVADLLDEAAVKFAMPPLPAT